MRVLNEWENKVNECVDGVSGYSMQSISIGETACPQIQLEYLHKIQRKFVLVPADKAANNVIVVCKKHYLDVVLNTTSTYECDDRECEHVVTEHLRYYD